MLKLSKLTSVMMFAGLLATVGAAQAVTINGGLVNGQNTISDESRETYVDANSNGLFDAGDVIFGYIRLGDFQPKGASANNQVYGVFSQQVGATSAGKIVNFVPTTVAGLTLTALLGGDPNVNASAIAAFYDKPVSYVDLVNNPAPGAPASMKDYITYIAGGTLRMVAGLDAATNWLQSALNPGLAPLVVGGSNSTFLSTLLSPGFQVAGNDAGLTLSYNNTNFIFNPQLALNPTLGLVLADITVSGNTKGANGTAVLPTPKASWLTAGGGATQCTAGGVNTPCGFEDKNDFVVDATALPEPGSLALVGLALAGLGAGLARRRKA